MNVNLFLVFQACLCICKKTYLFNYFLLKIIKFFSSFATSEGCIEAYTRVHELHNDHDFNKTYKFTCNDDYTHAIILNTAMPKLTIPKENVIGLAFEPIQFLGLTSVFIDYAINNISKYNIRGSTRKKYIKILKKFQNVDYNVSVYNLKKMF